MAQGIVVLDTPVSKTYTADSTWRDLDVSADIPAGATGVVLVYMKTQSSAYTLGFGARKKGATVDARFSDDGGDANGASYYLMAGVNTSRVCQYYLATGNTGTLYVVGYFDSQAVFFDNPIDKSSLTRNLAAGWYDIDMSANLAGTGAKGVIAFGYAAGKNNTFALRQNGDTFTYTRSSAPMSMIVGVDANNVFEFNNAQSDASQTLYIHGYIKSSFHWKSSATDTGITASTFTDCDITSITSANAKAALFINEAATSTTAVRNNGSSQTVIKTYKDAFGVANLDASQIFEGYTTSSSYKIKLLAYFEDVADSSSAISKVASVANAAIAKVSNTARAAIAKIAGLG